MASATAPTARTYSGIAPRAKQDAPSMKSQAIAEFRRVGSTRMLIHCRDRTEFVFAGLDDADRAIPAPRQVGYSSSAGHQANPLNRVVPAIELQPLMWHVM
jgi:hypothetical protein